MKDKIYPVAVIGGGSAGTMAVLRTVLNNDETLFFPGTPQDKKRSRALWVTKVENMPGHIKYTKGIEQPNRESLDWLSESEFKHKFHWHRNIGIRKIEKRDDGIFELTDSNSFQYLARFVIVCTGVMDVQPIINGDIEDIFPYANLQLADYCLRCDGHHVLNKKTALIGHDDGAAWVAIMLYERYETPSMKVLTHGQTPLFSADVVQLLKKYKIEVITQEIESILGNPKEKRLDGFKFVDGSETEVEICFIGLGMLVYNELPKMLGANLDNRGFVVTNSKGESSIPGLYVAGDLRAGIKKQIYTAWDSAVDSADDINYKIRVAKRNS